MGAKKILAVMLILLLSFYGFLSSGYAAGTIDDPAQTEKSDTEKTADSREKPEPFLRALVKDEAEIFTAPFRMSASDLLLWSGVALVTGIMIANDEAIYRNIKDFQGRNSWVDDVSPVITQLGDGGANLGIAGGFFLGGLIFKNSRAKDTARLLLMTFIHTGLVVQLGKHLTGRQRPSVDNGTDYWYGPSGFFKRYTDDISKYDAFPSGHTITAWGTATVIAHQYRDSVVVPILCYSLATLVGLSRVTEDTHWLSDVFLGAVLGYAIGRFMVRKRSRTWQVVPMADARGVGLGVIIGF